VTATLASILVCVTKGKYKRALFGCFVPVAAVVGTFRLARPGSRWARRRYPPEMLARAAERARRTDARWGGSTRWLNDFAGMDQPSTSS